VEVHIAIFWQLLNITFSVSAFSTDL